MERGSVTGTVLDVGSGTGVDSLRILAEFPSIRVVSLDLCEPMCRELEVNLRSTSAFGNPVSSRCTVVRGDVLAGSGEPSQLKCLLPESERGRGYRAVVTSLTVHHFGHDEKQEFYRRAFSVLEPSGVLINADLFSYASAQLSEDALRFDLEWMQRQFANPDRGFEEARTLSCQDRQRLCELWTNHYRVHNRLESIEDCSGKVGQAGMLEVAGFKEVAVPYRHSLSGVLWARK